MIAGMTPMRIVSIYISPKSNYWRRPKAQPGDAPIESPQSVECHAEHGLVGDRFYDYKENYKGQVTFMHYETLMALKKVTGKDFSLEVFRRNVILSGPKIMQLQGKKFQFGDVIFEGTEHCTPCHWMDFAAGDGAYAWLDKNTAGGLRARILQSGHISLGNEVVILG